MKDVLDTEVFKDIAAAFLLPGIVRTVQPFGSGHIHETFRLVCDEEYIVQKFNSVVFPEPQKVMENIEKVTSYIRKLNQSQGRSDLNVLSFLKSSGLFFYKDAKGNLWRTSKLIVNAKSVDRTDNQELLKEGGKAFGTFLKDLLLFDSSLLHETIPNFHNTESRFLVMEESVKRDVCGRASIVLKEIDELRSRNHLASVIQGGLINGTIPNRVTHNDTKINNVLFSASNNSAMCVVDLDTVMPGSMLYDFGDLVRTACATADEDERDLQKVNVNLASLKSITSGYLSVLKSDLSKTERELLYTSAILMTLELSVRFMTDFLDGDRYFRVHREGQNLDRARAQLSLVHALERSRSEGEKIISDAL